MSWLLRDGDVLAAVEARHRGWPASLQGAVVIRGPAVIQTLTKAVTLDVAWCGPVTLDGGRPGLEVRRIGCIGPHRVARPKLGPGRIVVASGGAFERWRLHVGDRLEIREV